jgi:hypothetical protein
MHRHLLRLHFQPPFANFIFFLAATLLGAGCGFVYPPPSIPDAVKGQVFKVGEPVALLSFEPGRTGGKIIGELHGWPFPHAEENQKIPAGTFTYAGQFSVSAKSDDDGMPAGAEGTRKIYFHDDPPQLNFADPRGYATGQEVALDATSMTFSFRENHRIIAVRMLSHQKSANPFAYRGKSIDPPKDRDMADTLRGEYSPDLGGYILRSLDE